MNSNYYLPMSLICSKSVAYLGLSLKGAIHMEAAPLAVNNVIININTLKNQIQPTGEPWRKKISLLPLQIHEANKNREGIKGLTMIYVGSWTWEPVVGWRCLS